MIKEDFFDACERICRGFIAMPGIESMIPAVVYFTRALDLGHFKAVTMEKDVTDKEQFILNCFHMMVDAFVREGSIKSIRASFYKFRTIDFIEFKDGVESILDGLVNVDLLALYIALRSVNITNDVTWLCDPSKIRGYCYTLGV